MASIYSRFEKDKLSAHEVHLFKDGYPEDFEPVFHRKPEGSDGQISQWRGQDAILFTIECVALG